MQELLNRRFDKQPQMSMHIKSVHLPGRGEPRFHFDDKPTIRLSPKFFRAFPMVHGLETAVAGFLSQKPRSCCEEKTQKNP